MEPSGGGTCGLGCGGLGMDMNQLIDDTRWYTFLPITVAGAKVVTVVVVIQTVLGSSGLGWIVSRCTASLAGIRS